MWSKVKGGQRFDMVSARYSFCDLLWITRNAKLTVAYGTHLLLYQTRNQDERAA